jgi:TRAP-type mannitol/chloroaromatic compound transport system substrate-binding protein
LQDNTAIECADANVWITAKYDADNPQALKQLAAEGALLRPYPLDILRAAHRATEEYLESVASQNPRFGKIHASWKLFRDDQYLWFRIAEDSFNRFVSLVAVQRNGK